MLPRFTARRYASVVYAVIVCLSVCSPVCHCTKMARFTITQNYHTIAQGLQFSDA